MPLSSKTTTTDTSRWSSTADDMVDLFEWKFGDPEPTGSHALAFAPHRRLREDLSRGKSDAESYDSNMIFVDIFKPVSKQLENLR